MGSSLPLPRSPVCVRHEMAGTFGTTEIGGGATDGGSRATLPVSGRRIRARVIRDIEHPDPFHHVPSDEPKPLAWASRGHRACPLSATMVS